MERRKKDSAKLIWDSKPKRAPNPKDIEFQTAELVIPNPTVMAQYNLPLFSATPADQLSLENLEIDKSQMNRLIWGDNLLAMQALLAQGYAGKIDLIYIDPPFLSSADYNFQMLIEGQSLDKEASMIEQLAYTDTWAIGIDSFLDTIYPRLQLMKRLLSDQGCIYIHIDYNVGHYVKIMMDEIFGKELFLSEVIWKRTSARISRSWGSIHDTLLLYTKGQNYTWNQVFESYDEKYLKSKYNHEDENGRYRTSDLTAAGLRTGNSGQPWRGYNPGTIGGHWKVNREAINALVGEEAAAKLTTQEKLDILDEHGLIYWPKSSKGSSPARPQFKKYLGKGVTIQDIITDIPPVNSQAQERLNYPTQKPEALLERIIQASSNPGDLVADFFCGSGTTLAVAERLGRRWIGCNLDKVGIQVSRNRLVQGHNLPKPANPFLLENIGNYQRQMIYLSGSKIGEMQRIILKLYGAQPRSDRPDLGVRTHDDGTTELVYVGYPDRPTTAKKVIELAKDAAILDGIGYKTLIILAWDYDYNFTSDLESRQKHQNLSTTIQHLTIPPEIYNYLKKAQNEEGLEDLKDKLKFHEKPYLKVSHSLRNTEEDKIIVMVQIDRYVLLNFPVPEKQQGELRKIIKDNFAVLIDYWAIDWDYDGKLFKSQWQAIRGNGKRAETVVTQIESPALDRGNRSISIRLVDIFGNDASTTLAL